MGPERNRNSLLFGVLEFIRLFWSRVRGLDFGIQISGLGFGVQVLGFEVKDLGFRVKGLGLRRFRVWG